jgi:hypothetical protein
VGGAVSSPPFARGGELKLTFEGESLMGEAELAGYGGRAGSVRVLAAAIERFSDVGPDDPTGFADEVPWLAGGVRG